MTNYRKEIITLQPKKIKLNIFKSYDRKNSKVN